MTEIERYIEIVKKNNKNGRYSREDVVKNNFKNIYDQIIEFCLNINTQSFVEKVYLFVNNISEKPKCLQCSKELIFKNATVGYLKFCSNSCGAKNNESKEKLKNTMLKVHGVTHSSLTKKSVEKRRKLKLENIKKLVDEKCIININDSSNDLTIDLLCDKCNKIHSNNYSTLYQRKRKYNISWRDCEIDEYSSRHENELFEFISEIYHGTIIKKDRNALGNNKEIDIYLPELKIGIEINGIWYHNELFKNRYYHHDKWKSAKEKNITLIQIYEDEWNFKKEIIKSRLRNMLLKNVIKIDARKCEIREVKSEESSNFLKDNHLQGDIKSSYRYGLYFKNELVSLITFGKPRKNMHSKKFKNAYELYRFCNKLNYTVRGGASRLFNHFKTKNITDTIFSFAALEWEGSIYEKIGMSLISISKDSYWYVVKGLRQSRHNFTKKKLVAQGHDKNLTEAEIMAKLKIYKIHGAGNSVWFWNCQSL